MSDFDVSAEFAAMFLATGPGLPAGVPRALDGIVAGLPLVDLGAGTGLATVALADTFPGTGIVAVEPSRAQRTALMTRLAGRPDLHARVTVVPADAFTADLPPRWGGAVAIHLLCQLPPPDRQRLLQLFADRLSDGAPAVVDWHYDADEPVAVPERQSATFTLGYHEYQRWFAADPAGPDVTRVRNTYRVLHAGSLVQEQVVERTLPLVRGSVLLAEAAAAGLTGNRPDSELLVLRRS